MNLRIDESISPLTSWNLQPVPFDPVYLASQDELRNLLFLSAQTPAPTRRGSPVLDETREKAADETTSWEHSSRTLLIGHRLEYLDNYIGCVASWLDMFDSDRAFAVKVPIIATQSPAVLFAILAISARQIECKNGIRDPSDSLPLYQEAIRNLKPLLEARDEDAIAVGVLLCCMEMMSASGEDWRRHLDGCAALFVSFGVNGFSDELRKALFWCYARMDLCGALMSNGTQSTLIEPWRWLPADKPEDPAEILFAQCKSPDMHANYSVYLCAKVCELLAERTKYVELGEENGCTTEVYATRWTELWAALRTWLEERPEELMPVQTLEAEPFPQILFAHWSGISSTQLHHTACLLLLDAAPALQAEQIATQNTIVSYAKRICGISLTNPHEGCINNAIQPLWIAGRHLTHRSEHTLLINLFKNIEKSTGWATSWRIADLERIWGYQVRRK